MLPEAPEVPKELTEGISAIREYRDVERVYFVLLQLYSFFHPLCHKVLKVRIWEFPRLLGK